MRSIYIYNVYIYTHMYTYIDVCRFRVPGTPVHASIKAYMCTKYCTYLFIDSPTILGTLLLLNPRTEHST